MRACISKAVPQKPYRLNTAGMEIDSTKITQPVKKQKELITITSQEEDQYPELLSCIIQNVQGPIKEL